VSSKQMSKTSNCTSIPVRACVAMTRIKAQFQKPRRPRIRDHVEAASGTICRTRRDNKVSHEDDINR
jgi:hypothetical protein